MNNDKSSIFDKINKMLDENDVVLFMKGDEDFPQCGFSANVVGILNYFNISFKSFNVLQDDELRQGIKDFSNWPTIPQLYVKGEFVGGCDIIKEMFEAGELKTYLTEKGVELAA